MKGLKSMIWLTIFVIFMCSTLVTSTTVESNSKTEDGLLVSTAKSVTGVETQTSADKATESGKLDVSSTTLPQADDDSYNKMSTTSAFDDLVLGYDSAGNTSPSDIDYMLATQTQSPSPESTTDSVGESEGTTDQEPSSSTLALLLETESTSEPSDTVEPLIQRKDENITVGAKTEEPNSQQLIRSRKSPGNITQLHDSLDLKQPPWLAHSQRFSNTTVSPHLTTDDTLAISPNSPPAIPNPSSPLDYDDFDLDYQLKMNTSLGSDSTLSLNKRDQDGIGVKAPSWSAIVMQEPHLFTSTLASVVASTPNSVDGNNSFTSGLNSSEFGQQAILPSLLTVHSTQLSNQELNRIKPQFLFYQDNNDQTYGVDQIQVNGDLLATASAAGVPIGQPFVVALNTGNTSSSKQMTGEERKAPTISLINGSPVGRQNLAFNNLVALRSNVSRAPDDQSSVTTIVVDNLTPTEIPMNQIRTSTQSTPTTSTSPTTSSTSASAYKSSTTNAPIIVTSGSIPAETTKSNNSSGTGQWQSLIRTDKQVVEVNQSPRPHELIGTTFAPSDGRQMNGQSATTSSFGIPNVINIIEKPTVSDNYDKIPSTINRTQLQMQLKEMQALAASNSIRNQHTNENQFRNIRPLLLDDHMKPNSFEPIHVNHVAKLHDSSGPVSENDNQNSPGSIIVAKVSPIHMQQAPVTFSRASENFNSLNHMFVNNQSPTFKQQPFTITTRPVAVHQSNIPGSPLRSNKISLYPANLRAITLTSRQPHGIQGDRSNQHIVRPKMSGQIVAAPSVLQQVYTPRPASMFPNFTSISQPTSSPNTNQNYEFPSFSGTQAVKMQTPESISLSKFQNQRTMSEEDMSTYVSHLAAMSSHLNINPTQDQTSPIATSESQQESQTSPVDGTKLSLDSNQELGDLAKLIEKIVSLSGSKQQPSRQSTPSESLTEQLLRQAKIVGLPHDVQSQIHHDLHSVQSNTKTVNSGHSMNPNDNSVESGANLSTWQPYKQSASEQQIDKIRSFFSSPTVGSHNGNYKTIEALQEQRKKDREQQIEQQNRNQRLKQMVFVEALKASLARLQSNNIVNANRELISSYMNSTTPSKVSTGGDAWHLQPTGSSSKMNQLTDFDDQIAAPRPQSQLPDWFEKQVVQDSLVHESGRVNPLGQTTITGKNPMTITPLHVASTRPVPITITPLASAPQRQVQTYPFHHHLHPFIPHGIHLPALASSLRPKFHPSHQRNRLTTYNTMTGFGSPNLELSGIRQVQPINTGKILYDRFPYASAPAFLVKLPTPTGGTITASGSMTYPSFKMNRVRGFLPMRYMNGPSSMMAAQKLRTLTSSLQSSPSDIHVVNHIPQSPTIHLHPLPSYSSPLYYPPASLSPATMSYNHQSNVTPTRGHAINTNTDTYNLDQLSSTPHTQTFTGSMTLQGSQSDRVNHPLHSTGAIGPNLDSQANRMYGNSASDASINQIGDQSNDPATSTLSRLQQATASLVELTSLASLVEEMVSGSDIESSPAAALANAINSISAAQSAALTTQATTNGPSSTNANLSQSGARSPSSDMSSQQSASPFSWRNLLNPNIWLDKSFMKSKDLGSLERLVAQTARRPSARLKVKYIRVPVAVYETSQTNTGVSDIDSKQLGRQQLAELIATGAQNPLSPSIDSISTAPQSSAALATLLSSSPAISSSSAIVAQPIPSQISVNSASQSPNTAGLSLNSAPAASSNDYLFDELSSDIVPQFALSSRDQQLIGQNDLADGREFLPIVRGVQRPLRLHSDYLRSNRFNQMSPLETAAYYSAVTSPMASITSLKSTEMKDTEVSSKSKKSKKKKKKKEEEDEEEDEDDDDDIISSSDLPAIESIISALVQGPPVQDQTRNQQQLPPKSTFGSNFWRSKPFGSSLRGEASNTVESIIRPPGPGYLLNPFGRHSPKFSLGEVVGALGAKKLISSLISKRKFSRTGKRALSKPVLPLKESSWLKYNPRKSSKTMTTTILPDVGDLSNSSTGKFKYPLIAAYELTATRRPTNKTQSRKQNTKLNVDTFVSTTSPTIVVTHFMGKNDTSMTDLEPLRATSRSDLKPIIKKVDLNGLVVPRREPEYQVDYRNENIGKMIDNKDKKLTPIYQFMTSRHSKYNQSRRPRL